MSHTPEFTTEQVKVIFVLGGPGAGKGTQCAKLVAEHDFVHLSAGDLLRAEQGREGSEVGALIKHYITEGLIVPQEITIQLLNTAIKENYAEGRHNFLIDGFPRKMDQAITFEEVIVPSRFVLFFDCPEPVMLERLLERGKTSGRDDDNAESIKKRFRTFEETSMPVVEYFSKQDKVVKIVCDKPVNEVYAEVETVIEKRL
ncbi:similar to Saccharomyces cerevisiae YKL024C URA6 Uridylate kinase [Maudiozyma barnettii]|uniref:Uridylate kinase n=1 Tax=Maudiozyma barnettii TaxID=61262 RepID=A0A8H2ZK01_9SACH|nr:bifunctional uridylate/adenylate kinase [Kazachstania barnettii]CAB4256473.1 similar to Saccharomyces cerevisiae YKL024C URA6 Uridylate kinase [Kazachstania barnettii]CAD1785082.1 similar to Saccharomyces cerevisiae YKL024C URA6 Uridylate kinase [Kazachstania barnettii]